MKALTRTFTLLFLSTLVFPNSMAQKASYTTNSGIIIGFGGGGAYQRSDLANSKGWGADFVFGSHLYKKENAFLSVDWKFRFLAGENRAFDHRINPDSTFSNIRYNFFTYDLELGLTLNRLRERTRIVITGFAGAGITHGRSFTDLYDAGSNLYDFSGIDPNRDSKLIYDELMELSDGDFETKLSSKAALLPTAGIFFGYQLSRSFTLGIEYKTNFYLTEENSITGIDLDNRILSGSGLDRNSYITLGFKWSLGGGASSGGRSDYSDVTSSERRTTTDVTPGSVPPPTVNITDPPAESYRTTSRSHTIRATVNNVSGPDNISFNQNGIPNNNFSYNTSTRNFEAKVNLRFGQNDFQIKATNRTSTAEDRVKITVENPTQAYAPAPAVRFSSPSDEEVTSSSERMDVTAVVRNISRKEDIQLTLNGSNTPFEFNPVSRSVTIDVPLVPGNNKLLIQGSNESGSAKDELTIIYDRTVSVAMPAVRFINPLEKVEVASDRFPLRAGTENVSGRNDVTLKLNGSGIGNFNFSPAGEVTANLRLSDGSNIVEITARNEAGVASERTTITYTKPAIRISPPQISIISPANSPFTTYEQSEDLRATVLNVNSKENITLNINGSNTRNFNFISATRELTASITLRDGSNTVTISAVNESGSDTKNQVFNKEVKICPLPVIRLIAPAQGLGSVDQDTYTLYAEVQNIAARNQLRLTINGSPTGFNFDNNLITSELSLRSGSNTIALNARNECGEDNATTSITYTPVEIVRPCPLPEVSITITEVDRPDATHELRGSVSEVNSRSGVSLSVNGSSNDGFRFIPARGSLSAGLTLPPGSNTIVVSVSNECGADSKSITVEVAEPIIEEPCDPPKLSFNVIEVDRADASHELRAMVSNVKDRSGISLMVNGRTDDGFQFIPVRRTLNAGLTLPSGSHTIVLSVSNECGAESKSVTVEVTEPVIEEPCNPPTVSFSVNEVDRADATHELTGSVTNIENRSDLSLSVNGKANDGFQFVPATGDLSARLSLDPGAHTIIVSVSNACGTDSKSFSVNVEEPCIPPMVSFSVNEIDRDDATHELTGSVSNVESRSGITLTVNGATNDTYQFLPATGALSARATLTPGSHTIVVSVSNACGTDSKSVTLDTEEPCIPPTVSITVAEVDRDDATHDLTGSVSNVDSRSGITLTVNGTANNTYQYVPATGALSARATLTPGSHTIVISVSNACGTDSETVNIVIEVPCTPPTVSFTITEVNRDDATHELSGSTTDVENKSDISLTVNGSVNEGFQFEPFTGEISASLTLAPGSYTIAILVNNDCGEESETESIVVEEEACGVRINPGNSSWQFCLITPSGTYTRDNLTDENFSYSGPATSIYFMPIGGGGDVVVNGNPYSVRSGQYYHFTGTLDVTVSTKNPGSMGHWSVCVSADREPESGQGNNRPKSPCEEEEDDDDDDGDDDDEGGDDVDEGDDDDDEGDDDDDRDDDDDDGDDDDECGVRINPGNSAWQFCMVTASGTYTRDDLTNDNFSYEGPASSLFFMPIGGGGEVLVNGSPYTIRSGRYYLFTGTLA